MLRQRGGIAGAVQDANDHKLFFVMQVVDGVVAGEAYPQTGGKILTRGRGEREMAQRLAIILDFVDQARRSRL
jgi:hypothetical protein